MITMCPYVSVVTVYITEFLYSIIYNNILGQERWPISKHGELIR